MFGIPSICILFLHVFAYSERKTNLSSTGFDWLQGIGIRSGSAGV
jgi:hypothetical protein